MMKRITLILLISFIMTLIPQSVSAEDSYDDTRTINFYANKNNSYTIKIPNQYYVVNGKLKKNIEVSSNLSDYNLKIETISDLKLSSNNGIYSFEVNLSKDELVLEKDKTTTSRLSVNSDDISENMEIYIPLTFYLGETE